MSCDCDTLNAFKKLVMLLCSYQNDWKCKALILKPGIFLEVGSPTQFWPHDPLIKI